MRLVGCCISGTSVFALVLVWKTYMIASVSAPAIFITNNATTEKGQDVQLTCDLGLTPGAWSSNVIVYKTETADITKNTDRLDAAICHEYECLRFHSRYIAESDGFNIYINISKLNRSEDEKFWTCRNEDSIAQMFLTVYTTPTASQLISSFDVSHALSEGSLSMTCKTDRCAYKDPVFIWHLVFANGSRQVFEQGTTTSWNSDVSCGDSEMIYYSKLSLQENSTFTDNIDITVRFLCAISFPTLKKDLVSSPSGNVTFAVEITSVEIYDGDQVMTDNRTITVTDNIQNSIMCKAGPSRPQPIFLLYVRTQIIKESKNETLTFIPSRHQHGDKIYCRAYNLQGPDNAVVSHKPHLFVNIPVSKAILRDGDEELERCSFINVSEGILKTLSCTADECRPSPTIIWYIGNSIRQNHTSNIFTFIPETDNHDKNIHCETYNLPGFQPVESSKPKLRVIGRSLPPLTFLFTSSYGQNATFYWIAGYDGGYKQSFVLQYRKTGENIWINNTESAQTFHQDTESSLQAYTGQIKILAPGVYQARLIARNIHGEANPVNVMGSTFRIAPAESEASPPLSQSSTPVLTTGTIMGCVILLLIGIIVYQFVSFKRRQIKCSTPTEIKLESIPDTSVQTPSTYEELTAVAQVTGSTYDALKTPELKDRPTREYENTTVR